MILSFILARLPGFIPAKLREPVAWALLALAALALLAALVFTVVRIFDNAVEDGIDAAKEAGSSTAVITGNKVTLDQVGVANDAGYEIRRDAGFARYCECVQSATDATSGHCVRYLKDQPVPDRQPAAGVCGTDGKR
jgi:hypothetical protein